MALASVFQDRVNCRVTLLTPPSRSAVATISVEGLDAPELVASHFYSRVRRSDPTIPVGRILLGDWRNPRGSTEEIVLCRRGEHSFELNCHGGTAASEAIIGSLVDDGAARRGPSAWLAERVADPIQRAAWLSLCQARTPRAACILLDQFRGALTRTIAGLVELSRCVTQDCSEQAATIGKRLSRLVDLADVGLHLTNPWRVVFAGPPNAGKSSLVNAVLGYQRAIVCDEPGTTRDVLTAATALDGWPVELFDTAGLRESSDAVEVEGVARARSRITEADLVVYVVDSTSTKFGGETERLPARIVLRAANKWDLPAARDGGSGDWLRTSAVSGFGVEQLMQAIVARLVPTAPESGEAVPFTSHQAEQLRLMREAASGGAWAQAIQAGASLLGDCTPGGPV